MFLAKLFLPKKGKIVSNVSLGHFFGKPDKHLKFSDLRGKLVLLDFFSIWCSSCIAAMPGMDSLQNEFGNKIQIILVTKNTDAEENKLFTRIKLKIPHLLVLTNDTRLNKLFPHYGEPHHVWIDQDGIYRIATFDYNATRKNIRDFLDKKTVHLSDKKDNGVYKEGESLLKQTNSLYGLVSSYSILMKGLFEFTFSNEIKVEKDSVTKYPVVFRAINAPPLNLLQSAYDKDIYGYEYGLFNSRINKRLIVEVNNKAALYQPMEPDKIDDWKKKNLWSYEVKVNAKGPDDLYHRMQNELEAVLPYKANIELRDTKCFVLVRMNNDTAIKVIAPKSEKQKTVIRSGVISLMNTPLLNLIEQLNYAEKIPYLVIDQTGITENVDLTVSVKSLQDINSLKNEISKYGLDIIEKNVKTKFLVITDK